MVTHRTPASTSRRAIRQHWPSECRPYSSRSLSGSAWMSNAFFACRRGHQVERLVAERADAPRPARLAFASAALWKRSTVSSSSLAVVEAVAGDGRGRHEVRHAEVRGVRVGVDDERRVARRRGTPARRSGAPSAARRRPAPTRAARASSATTEPTARPLVVRVQVRVEPGRGEVAGEDVVVGRAVVRVVVPERADQRELVHLPWPTFGRCSQTWTPGTWSSIGLELAAELGRRVRLQVERVDGGSARRAGTRR